MRTGQTLDWGLVLSWHLCCTVLSSQPVSFLELMWFQDSPQDLEYEMPLGQDNKEEANNAAVAYRHWK